MGRLGTLVGCLWLVVVLSSPTGVNARKLLHSLIRRLGGRNVCRPKASTKCQPWEQWFDKVNNHEPVPNGCGSRDLPVNLAKTANFTGCCSKHDICYSRCSESKAVCDEAFHECMISLCKSMYENAGRRKAKILHRCLDEASLYYSGTVGLGCGAYKRAQLKHCACRLKSDVEQILQGREGEEEGDDEEEEEEEDYWSDEEDGEWPDEDFKEEEWNAEDVEGWQEDIASMMEEDEAEWFGDDDDDDDEDSDEDEAEWFGDDDDDDDEDSDEDEVEQEIAATAMAG